MLDERDEKFFSEFDYNINLNKELTEFILLVRANLLAMRDTLIDLSVKVEGLSEETAARKYQDYADEHFTNLMTAWTDKYGKLSDEHNERDGKNQ
jgi:hypothetical protein